MKKTELLHATKALQKSIIKYQPELLTGFGITGMFSAIGMAITATIVSCKEVEQAKKERKRESGSDEWTRKDTIKQTWHHYIPTVVTAGVSATCLIGSNKISTRRNAALAAAYTLSESAFKDYKEKVVETLGEKKEKEVRDAISSDRAEKIVYTGSENLIIKTGYGNTKFIDEITGQLFECSVEHIRKAENRMIKRLFDEGYISVNDLYFEIGLRPTRTGGDLGWNISKGDTIELEFGCTLIDEVPFMTLQYRNYPKPDFDMFR